MLQRGAEKEEGGGCKGRNFISFLTPSSSSSFAEGCKMGLAQKVWDLTKTVFTEKILEKRIFFLC